MESKLKIIIINFTFLVTLLITSILYADTIRLADDSVITGKVIGNQKTYYIFANTHGTFQVKKKFISKLYRTSSYMDDVKIHSNLGKHPNIDQIKADFMAGMKKKEKLTGTLGEVEDSRYGLGKYKSEPATNNEEPGDRPWTYGRLTFSMAYFSTFLSELDSKKGVSTVLPSGIGANLTYDQGLEFKKQHMGIPGLTIEHSFIYFTKSLFVSDSREVVGHGTYVGLMWALPGLKSRWGYFTLNAMPGAGFIQITNKDSSESASTITFAFKAAFGYEIQYKKVTFKFNLNYTYLIDVNVSFHGIGGSFGLAFKLW